MMVDIKWKPVGIGLIIAIVIGTVVGILTSWGDLLGYLIGSVVAAYLVGGNYKNGVIHGVIVGFVSAAVVLVLGLLGLSVMYTTNLFLAGWIALTSILILAIVIGGITGTLGGIIGILIKNRSH